ncbi:MAG: PTS sugar transporter subunit IIB [Armatimonadetes bacterium]|nr:PTS sugar transporter subunit IIB [Armatimonadota bacterium]
MKILLICSAGMSTSLLVQAMRKTAKESQEEIIIDSSGSEALEEIINQYDVLLVGPQVRHRLNRFSEIAKAFNKPIAVIDSKTYGLLDGQSALKQARELLAGNPN